jgi:hypothetical protein
MRRQNFMFNVAFKHNKAAPQRINFDVWRVGRVQHKLAAMCLHAHM